MSPRRSHPRKRLLRGALLVLLVVGGAFLGASSWVGLRYRSRIVPPEEAPTVPVALVFGAGLAAQGVPSAVLAERLEAAVALWRAGKVRRLLLSGDTSSDRWHDETAAMRRYALAKGVPDAVLTLDRAGLSTYDSVARARQVYGVKQVVLVTQRFHLPRALYLANGLGLDAWGVAADGQPQGVSPYALRELVSRPLALAQVWTRPAPAKPSGFPGRAERE